MMLGLLSIVVEKGKTPGRHLARAKAEHKYMAIYPSEGGYV